MLRLLLTKDNSFLFSSLLLYKLVVDYSYYFINQNINIGGLYSFNFDFSNYIIGWLLTIITYCILLYKKKVAISFILFFIYYVYIIPNIVYFSLSNQEITFLLYIVFPYSIIVFSIKNSKLVFSLANKVKINYIIYCSIFIAICVLINLVYKTDGNFIHDFDYLYAFRKDYSGTSFFKIFNYLELWTIKVLSLFLLSYSLMYNKKLLLLFSVFLILILFLFTGYKIIILSFILVFYLFYLFKLKNRIHYLLITLILLLVFLLFYTKYTNNIMPASILIRRFLFMPVILNYEYFNFFTKHEYVYWSNSILKYFFIFSYDKNIPSLIGTSLGFKDMYANTGFIAMGFAHAGPFGVFLYTMIASMIFNVINLLINDSRLIVQISVVILPIYTLFISSDLFTTLLSHGLFPAIILLYLLNSVDNNNK